MLYDQGQIILPLFFIAKKNIIPKQSKEKASLRVRGILLDPAAQRKKQLYSINQKSMSTRGTYSVTSLNTVQRSGWGNSG